MVGKGESGLAKAEASIQGMAERMKGKDLKTIPAGELAEYVEEAEKV